MTQNSKIIASKHGIAEQSLMVDEIPFDVIAKYDKGESFGFKPYSSSLKHGNSKSYIGIHKCDNYQITVPSYDYIIYANSESEAKEKMLQLEDEIFFKLVKSASPTIEIP